MNLEEVHWYYIDESNNDAQVGPFVIKDFKEKFLSGLFTPESYCWHEEIDEWEKLKNIHFRNKQALQYFSEAIPQVLVQDIAPKPASIMDNPTPPAPKTMTIEEEIKERLRKKFANK